MELFSTIAEALSLGGHDRDDFAIMCDLPADKVDSLMARGREFVESVEHLTGPEE